MKREFVRLSLALVSTALMTVAGCGGGGGSGSGSGGGGGGGGGSVTLSGTAATGAAFVGAVVNVTDSTGAPVGTSAPVGTNGTYSVVLSAGAQAPFVLVASRTSADGEVQSLVSLVESASVTTANVTPITNLIASRLSSSGDPSRLASELAAGTTQINAAAVAETVAEVKAILATLLEATGTSGTDPLTGTFAADGTGYDRLLDSIAINIVPAGSTSSNIEIAVKQQLPDGTQPATVSFPSDSANVPPPLPPISTSTLVEAGTSVKITDFLADLTRCFAVPFAERVNGVTSGTVNAVVGSAADVVAPACRAVFWGDNPANYLSNGNTVGRNASNGGSFAGLFRRGATGAVFSQGSYEFTRSNGDVVMGYKSRGTDGSELFDTLVVRQNPDDDKFQLIGNQYGYSGGVTAYQQHRQFITLDQENYSYRSTGYTVNIDDRKDGLGNSIFDRVEVTTPRGNTLTLRPVTGYSYLNLVKGTDLNARTVGTNFVRLHSVFDNAATTAVFANIEPSLFFSNQVYDDAAIAAIPSQSTWSFRYFLAGNTGSTPNTIQTYKTRARAMTIAELQSRGLAQLSAQDISDIKEQAGPSGIDFAGAPDNVVNWTVPAGALPPTQVTLFGVLFDTTTNPWTRRQGFNDAISFGSTARASPLTPCSPSGSDDLHCSNTPVSGSYAAGAYVNSVHLWARESSGREFASFYAFYQLRLPPTP